MMQKVGTVLLIGLIFLLVISSADAFGVGVTPSRITMGDAMKGGAYDRQLAVYNPADESCNYEFAVTGDIEDWVSFYALDGKTPIDTIEVSGKETEKVIARFSIPAATPNGNYLGTIDVQTTPKGVTIETGMAAEAVVKASSEVTIRVTGTQTLTGNVESITAVDTEINYPVRIQVTFKNTGNVAAYPAIDVSISKDDSLVDSFTHDKTAVTPKETMTIPVEWNTTGQTPGDYSLNVTVSLNGDVLATKSLPVKILPAGTLTREGNLIGISTPDEPVIGQYIKILATFENTGAIDTKAKFAGELYIDGNREDVINSDELVVLVGETSDLTTFLKIETPGNYVIKGHVLYDGKTTGTKELSFIVTKAESETGTGVPGFGIIGALMAIAILVVFIVARKKLLKK